MKQLLLLILFGTFSLSTLQAQHQYSWDVVIDSLDGDKDELFSKTKMFVAENLEISK